MAHEPKAIEIVEPGLSGVIVGQPKALNALSDKLVESSISHAYLYAELQAHHKQDSGVVHDKPSVPPEDKLEERSA